MTEDRLVTDIEEWLNVLLYINKHYPELYSEEIDFIHMIEILTTDIIPENLLILHLYTYNYGYYIEVNLSELVQKSKLICEISPKSFLNNTFDMIMKEIIKKQLSPNLQLELNKLKKKKENLTLMKIQDQCTQKEFYDSQDDLDKKLAIFLSNIISKRQDCCA